MICLRTFLSTSNLTNVDSLVHTLLLNEKNYSSCLLMDKGSRKEIKNSSPAVQRLINHHFSATYGSPIFWNGSKALYTCSLTQILFSLTQIQDNCRPYWIHIMVYENIAFKCFLSLHLMIYLSRYVLHSVSATLPLPWVKIGHLFFHWWLTRKKLDFFKRA